ncbi:MAG: DUF2946 family protein [Magnetospirillum sp.]
MTNVTTSNRTRASRRRTLTRVGAWVGLLLLALDIFLGTAIPVARAAQNLSPIPVADLAVCTMDGMAVAGDRDDDNPPAEASVFCSACLPLVQMLAPPVVPAFAAPTRIHGYVVENPVLPWRSQNLVLGFSARAPPAFV